MNDLILSLRQERPPGVSAGGKSISLGLVASCHRRRATNILSIVTAPGLCLGKEDDYRCTIREESDLGSRQLRRRKWYPDACLMTGGQEPSCFTD